MWRCGEETQNRRSVNNHHYQPCTRPLPAFHLPFCSRVPARAMLKKLGVAWGRGYTTTITQATCLTSVFHTEGGDPGISHPRLKFPLQALLTSTIYLYILLSHPKSIMSATPQLTKPQLCMKHCSYLYAH